MKNSRFHLLDLPDLPRPRGFSSLKVLQGSLGFGLAEHCCVDEVACLNSLAEIHSFVAGLTWGFSVDSEKSLWCVLSHLLIFS